MELGGAALACIVLEPPEEQKRRGKIHEVERYFVRFSSAAQQQEIIIYCSSGNGPASGSRPFKVEKLQSLWEKFWRLLLQHIP